MRRPRRTGRKPGPVALASVEAFEIILVIVATILIVVIVIIIVIGAVVVTVTVIVSTSIVLVAVVTTNFLVQFAQPPKRETISFIWDS